MIQLNRLYYESKPSCISKSKIHINQSVSNPQSLNGIKLVQSNGFTFMIWAAIFRYCFYFFLPNLHMWDSPVGDLLFLFVFVFLLHLMKYLCGNLLVFNFIMCVWWSLVCDMLMFNVSKKNRSVFFWLRLNGTFSLLDTLRCMTSIVGGHEFHLMHDENWEKIRLAQISYFHRNAVATDVDAIAVVISYCFKYLKPSVMNVILIYSTYTCYRAIIVCTFAHRYWNWYWCWNWYGIPCHAMPCRRFFFSLVPINSVNK